MTNIYFARNELQINSDHIFSGTHIKYSNFMIDSTRDYVSSRGKKEMNFYWLISYQARKNKSLT